MLVGIVAEVRDRAKRMSTGEPLTGYGLAEHTDLVESSDRMRAMAEVDLARWVGSAAATGVHRDDGHTTVAAWCRATRRWSETEIRQRVRLAKLLARFPDLAEQITNDDLGVAQAHTLAAAAANPRCGDQIDSALPILLAHAGTLSHADFHRVVAHWERLADADGAHRDADRSHQDRRGWWSTDNDGDFHLHLRCGAAQGAQISAVVDRFVDAEFQTDWAQCVAEHGDRATPTLLRRSDAQRRADALVALAVAAVSTPPGAQQPHPLVNIVVDHTTIIDFLDHHGSGDRNSHRHNDGNVDHDGRDSNPDAEVASDDEGVPRRHDEPAASADETDAIDVRRSDTQNDLDDDRSGTRDGFSIDDERVGDRSGDSPADDPDLEENAGVGDDLDGVADAAVTGGENPAGGGLDDADIAAAQVIDQPDGSDAEVRPDNAGNVGDGVNVGGNAAPAKREPARNPFRSADVGVRADVDVGGGRFRPPPPARWRGCATTDGRPIPIADAIAAMLLGRIRIVVTDERGVILHMGRTQRLFTGKLRDAVMLGSHHCIWNGCNRPVTNCQADHVTDWQHNGTTEIGNGAPLCAQHNRLKNNGYQIHRDADGRWHTLRPNGTEI